MTVSQLHPRLIFLIFKHGLSTQVENQMGLQFRRRFLALTSNIRLGWKCHALTNALAFYALVCVAEVKKFNGIDPIPGLPWKLRNFDSQTFRLSDNSADGHFKDRSRKKHIAFKKQNIPLLIF